MSIGAKLSMRQFRLTAQSYRFEDIQIITNAVVSVTKKRLRKRKVAILTEML